MTVQRQQTKKGGQHCGRNIPCKLWRMGSAKKAGLNGIKPAMKYFLLKEIVTKKY